MKYNDYPLEDCVAQAEVIIGNGGRIHQKWTCRHCGARQSMGEPNVFYRSGRCEECNNISIIQKCNYVAIWGIRHGTSA